mmetsp:Transcript_17718/g.44950  ORF Transcript_17718/g.44950 Transcript_17718/m.44950 type:complete len:247 (+) Transcript_17718:469-1209(+)
MMVDAACCCCWRLGAAGAHAQRTLPRLWRAQAVRVGHGLELIRGVPRHGKARRDGASGDPAQALAHQRRHVVQLLSLSFHLLCDHVYAQVKGDGVKAAAVHELDPLLLRLGVVSLDVAAHPRNLTCEIAVVGRVLEAALNERCPVVGVGPHGADDGGRLRRHGVQGRGVVGVRHQHRDVLHAGAPKLLQGDLGLLQLVAAAARHRPFHGAATVARQQLLAHQPASEPAGTKDDHVIRPSHRDFRHE